MQNISARDAKARFGRMLDAARREPVTIEKHGRPVAVVLSKEEFDELETIKLERFRTMVQEGIDDIARGNFVEVEAAALERFVDDIMAGYEPADAAAPD